MTKQTEINKKLRDPYKTQYFGKLTSKYLYNRFKKNIKFPLLDVGAGAGDFIKLSRKKFPNKIKDIYGIDLLPKPELNIIEGDIKNMPFDDNYFKTIICSEVLEHLDKETLRKGLDEIHRILEKKGNALFTVPFKEDLSKSIITCPYCEKKFHKVGHVRSFNSKEQLRNLFKNHNLKIKYIEILPLGAVATIPILRCFKFILNKLDNPPGLKKRAIILTTI